MTGSVWLLASGIAVWLVALVPGYLLGGEQALTQSVAALILCLVPALATFHWAERAGNSPEKQLVATLGGSGIRMLVVLAASAGLRVAWPGLFDDYFWIWIAVFYLALLTMETLLLVRNKTNAMS